MHAAWHCLMTAKLRKDAAEPRPPRMYPAGIRLGWCSRRPAPYAAACAYSTTAAAWPKAVVPSTSALPAQAGSRPRARSLSHAQARGTCGGARRGASLEQAVSPGRWHRSWLQRGQCVRCAQVPLRPVPARACMRQSRACMRSLHRAHRRRMPSEQKRRRALVHGGQPGREAWARLREHAERGVRRGSDAQRHGHRQLVQNGAERKTGDDRAHLARAGAQRGRVRGAQDPVVDRQVPCPPKVADRRCVPPLLRAAQPLSMPRAARPRAPAAARCTVRTHPHRRRAHKPRMAAMAVPGREAGHAARSGVPPPPARALFPQVAAGAHRVERAVAKTRCLGRQPQAQLEQAVKERQPPDQVGGDEAQEGGNRGRPVARVQRGQRGGQRGRDRAGHQRQARQRAQAQLRGQPAAPRRAGGLALYGGLAAGAWRAAIQAGGGAARLLVV